MKKVIIISYFLPPANFVGSERVQGWINHLHENDIYPIVITRQWNKDQTNVTDKVQQNVLEHEVFETHEVYRVPYKQTLRDRLFNSKKLPVLRKALTLWEVIMVNFLKGALPYSNIYKTTKKILKENNDIEVLIASGRPFQTFSIGYHLKKEFTIKWIPDYRDEWTTHPEYKNDQPFGKLVHRLEKKSELKWTSNADYFTTVSDTLVDNISKFIGIKGFSILNGFSETNNPTTIASSTKKEFNILYSGSVYPYQNFQLILDAISNLNQKLNGAIRLTFVGVDLDSDTGIKLLEHSKENDFVLVLPRTNKLEYQSLLNNADLLFLTSYEQNKGWYPVKLFDYYKTIKPILLCPSDNDVIEEFIISTESGYIADAAEACESTILMLFDEKSKGSSISMIRNEHAGMKFSRKYQTKKLADLIFKDRFND